MNFLVARAEKHFWEEPVISGSSGSGTIFFGGCTLRCVYCQNYQISHGGKGVSLTSEQLVNLMQLLQDKGAHNINLVTPSHYARPLSGLLKKARHKIHIPIVYNCGGYDKEEDLKLLEGLIDIYLPDLKYYSSVISYKYSGKSDYFDVASRAVTEMRRQQPKDIFKNELMKKGIIVRHLILPSNTKDSMEVLDFLAKLDKTLYVSVMAQYFPTVNAAKFPELNRRLHQSEYDDVCGHFFKVGLSNGFMQDLESAIEEYVPDFDLNKLNAGIIEAEQMFAL